MHLKSKTARSLSICCWLTAALLVFSIIIRPALAQAPAGGGAGGAPAVGAPAGGGGGGGAAAGGETKGKVKSQTMWEMIKGGGPTLVVLVCCSIFTLTLIIERFMFYR